MDLRKSKNVPRPRIVQIISLEAFGAQFENLVPGSGHEVISPPEGEVDGKGCWVMGIGTPVKLFEGEFVIISE